MLPEPFPIATARPTGSVLHVVAARPGPRALAGVPLHVHALLVALPAALRVSVVWPAGGSLLVARRDPRRVEATLDATDLGAALAAALAGTSAEVLHVHSPELGPRALAAAAHEAGARLVVTLHDHHVVCERHLLLDDTGRYCGVPRDTARCDRCLGRTAGRPAGTLARHRQEMRALLEAADRIVVPSRSVLELASLAHPGLEDRAVLLPWGVPAPAARSAASASAAPRLALGVVARFTEGKGAGRLPALLAACRGLDVEVHLFGATEGASTRALRAALPGARVHGAYSRGDLAGALVGAGVHLAVIPSIFPESFSLTLSEIAAAGVPSLVADLGALGERARGEGLGLTFDPWDAPGFGALVGALSRDRARVDDLSARVRAARPRSEQEQAADLAAVYAAVLARRPRAVEPPPAARAGWEEGRARARAPRARALRALGELVDRARESNGYRELPLRRVVPLEARRGVEALLARALHGRGRP